MHWPSSVMGLSLGAERYCAHFWLPHYRKDVETTEKMQRRFTRMLPGLGDMPYEIWLNELSIFSLVWTEDER